MSDRDLQEEQNYLLKLILESQIIIAELLQQDSVLRYSIAGRLDAIKERLKDLMQV